MTSIYGCHPTTICQLGLSTEEFTCARAVILLHVFPGRRSLFEASSSGLRLRNLKTEVSLWKRIELFSVHSTPEEFKNGIITGYFGFVFEENSDREITWLSGLRRFRKAPFHKVFPSTRQRKAGVFKFLPFKERFRKVPFSWRIINNYWMRFLWYPE